MRWKIFRFNLNIDSGKLNTDSGKSVILFNFNRNGCSNSLGMPVQIEPECVFKLGRNMQGDANGDAGFAAFFG